VSTTPEPADHRGERPETEGPPTEAGHQGNRASTAPAPVARLVDSNGLHRASTWTALGTMGGPIASSHRAQPANLLMQQGSVPCWSTAATVPPTSSRRSAWTSPR
jgi:hypothetical protein